MATPDELKKQKELNDLLEQENKILREKLKLQSEGYDISSTLLENLKEVLGIESRRSTFDAGVLDINKKINRAIRDQKLEFNDIKGIQKQIQKNYDLITKAKMFEESLEKSLSKTQKKKAEDYLKRVNLANKYNQEIEEELAKAEKGEKINGRFLGSRKGLLTIELRRLASEEKSLGYLAKQYVYTKQQKAELEKINKEREKEEKNLKDIDKKLGVTSGILKGLSKTPFLKDLGIDFDEALEKAQRTTSMTKNGVAGLAAALKSVGTQFTAALTNPANLTLMVMGQIYNTFKNVDKATGDLAKSFNITYDQANDVRKRLTEMAIDSGDVAVNTRALQESLVAVGSALGSNAELNKKDLITFTQMREKAGLTNEELTEMQKLTYVSGGNLEDNLGSLMASAKMTGLNNKMLLNEKDIMRDVVKTSNAIKLSLGSSSEALGAAAAQVKVLGMNMQQVENIAGSLLDFESSISAELEAELLTGKDLNLERARLYAINNDMAGVAREIRKNYGDTAEFAKLNRIQQEAAAKAVGMTREDLARTLTDEKALQGLNAEDRNAAQVALDFARAQGMTEAQIGAKSIEDLKNQMGIQERLNASVEKLKESFVVIAEVLVPIFSGFANLVGWLAQSKVAMGAILGIATALVAIQTTLAIKSLITAFSSIFTGSFMAGPFGLPIAIGAAATLGGIIGGVATLVGDMGYDNKTGKTTISTRKGGLFAISDDDQIRVEPNALNKNTINKPKSSQDARLGEIIKTQQNQMSEMINLQRSQSNRPIIVQSSVQVEGKELAKIVGNNPKALGGELKKDFLIQ